MRCQSSNEFEEMASLTSLPSPEARGVCHIVDAVEGKLMDLKD